MENLRLYDFMSKVRPLNYRAKILLLAFCGTHVPLLALIAYFVTRSTDDWGSTLRVLGVALIATLVGTALTLLMLDHLLRPVLAAASALRAYRTSRRIEPLPTHYRDEVGQLMADAGRTIASLDSVMVSLETVDPITGLPKRGKLVLDMEERIASGDPFLVIAFRSEDYRRLAEAVDTRTAETAMIALAQRLQSVLPRDSFYRLGERDLVMVRGNTGDAGMPADIAAELKEVLQQCAGSLKLDAVVISPSMVAGVSMFPDDGDAAESLINQAYSALSLTSPDVKVGFHSPKAREAAFNRFRLEQDLHRALERQNEFVLHYQPMIDLQRGRVVGAEALIRWQHPEFGLLQPGDFIAIAEAAGMIEAIGKWVLREACQQLRRWNDDGLSGLRLSVNISASEFLNPRLASFVDQAVREAGIAADQLEIELTETDVMADAVHTVAAFAKLRELGVHIAIDDFGTGYASMSRLHQLSFDKLKLDREFIASVQDKQGSQAICNAVVALTRGLDLQLLAEGTETAEEVEFLAAIGCNLFQGFYFARPMPPEIFRQDIDRISLSAMAIAMRASERRVEAQEQLHADARARAAVA